MGRCSGFRAGIATTDNLVDRQSDSGSWGTCGCLLRRHILDFECRTLHEFARDSKRRVRCPGIVVEVPDLYNWRSSYSF